MNVQQPRPKVMPLLRKHRGRGRTGMGEASRRVTWIDGSTPKSEEAQLVFEAISRKGLTTFEEVVRYVADTLYWRDFLRGGWATDIGLLRPLYRREARETLERFDGRLIRIQ